jgi:pyrroline-5-carboxylate reductase
MKLGFVGTGTITAAIVDGLAAAGTDLSIALSPRNAETAAALAARHSNAQVARSNQAVLDESDVVMLAVRPQIVDDVLRQLRFRPDHRVVSLVAAVSLDRLHRAVAPASHIARAVPLPSVARRQGPTALYPAMDIAKALFDTLGTAVPLESEAALDIFSAATAVMSSYFAFAGTVSGWMERHGVAPEAADTFVRQMLRGLATAAPDRSFAALAQEHQTRGGLNEQVVRAVAPGGTIDPLDAALESVLARIKAAAG